MGGIREDFVGRFCGSSAAGAGLRRMACHSLLPTVAHYIIFKPRTPDSPCRMRAFGSAIPRLFIPPVLLQPHPKAPSLPPPRAPPTHAGLPPPPHLPPPPPPPPPPP